MVKFNNSKKKQIVYEVEYNYLKLKRFQDSSPSGLVTNLIGNANNIVREIKYLATGDLNYVPITSKYFSFEGMIYSKINF